MKRRCRDEGMDILNRPSLPWLPRLEAIKTTKDGVLFEWVTAPKGPVWRRPRPSDLKTEK